MRNSLVLVIALLIGLVLWKIVFYRSRPVTEAPEIQATVPPKAEVATALPTMKVVAPPSTQTPVPMPILLPRPLRSKTLRIPKANKAAGGRIRDYTLDDGLAVIEGDIVLGQPVNDTGVAGAAAMPDMKLWDTNEIPFYIQPGVSDSDRIKAALNMFAGTVLRFVPLTDQEDAIVFEDVAGTCKSYVGKIGGKQPIWISSGCGPSEVAHEVMHALGFVHEQNRADRDSYIQVMKDNIDPKFFQNFEKLSMDFMQASGASPFDFDSIMIYPTTMFNVNNRPTMQTKISGKAIAPSETLSPQDVARVNAVYGPREKSR